MVVRISHYQDLLLFPAFFIMKYSVKTSHRVTRKCEPQRASKPIETSVSFLIKQAHEAYVIWGNIRGNFLIAFYHYLKIKTTDVMTWGQFYKKRGTDSVKQITNQIQDRMGYSHWKRHICITMSHFYSQNIFKATSLWESEWLQTLYDCIHSLYIQTNILNFYLWSN